MKIKTISHKVYLAKDGKRFDNKNDCVEYENRLAQLDKFGALMAKVDTIECIENGEAPFGYYYVDNERYEYRWYRPKSIEEAEALNNLFNIDIAAAQNSSVADIVGSWVGIEIDGGYDTYTGKEDTYVLSALKCSNKRLVKFYAELGYNVKFEKQKSAVDVRDNALKLLWEQLEDIPINVETECIDNQYLHFPAGTHRETIWKWFDTQYSKGVVSLLYGNNAEGGDNE